MLTLTGSAETQLLPHSGAGQLADDDRGVQRVVDHLVGGQVALASEEVRLLPQQEGLSVLVQVVEELLVLLAVVQRALDQQVHELHPRVRDLLLVQHLLPLQGEQLGVLLAVHVDDGVVEQLFLVLLSLQLRSHQRV